MSERTRVPMPRRVSFVKDEEINANIASMPPVGRRFSMDVDEELIRRMGREAIPQITQRLAEQVVYENSEQIRRVVESYILDREWAESIIREEISKAVREVIRGMLGDPTP